VPLKNALIIILLIINTIASATDYYISSSGNDANNGLSSSTPWKTIAKINSAFSIMKPGDRILFNRGDVFTGQITLTQSGSATDKITFDAYGVGNTPVIQGNIDIISWTRFNGNIWVADCPQLGSTVTNFLINGKSQQIGRYPNVDATNKGYLTINSHVGNTQLTSTSLTSSPNWTGAEAVVRSARWVLDRVPIQSHQGNVLIFSSSTTYDIKDNYGFFIQNHLNTLDQQGEWYFNSADKKMYLYSSIDPNSMKTEASAFASTFMASNQSYFSIENIEFKGSFKKNINILNSSYVEMKYNIISESGADAVYFVDCNNINYEKNKIINTNGNGLAFYNCKNIVAISNEIHNIGLRAGMSNGYNGVIMYYQVKNCTFENNIIDSVGYNGVFFGGDSITIRNNVITNFCMTLDDGAGLYTSGDEILKFHNRTLQNNLVVNGIGAGNGTDDPISTAAEGIYMDDLTTNVELINNTVAYSSRGIFIHNSNNISIIGNTLYGNKTQILFVHDQIAPTYPITRCNVNGNIFFSKLKSQVVADFRTIDNGIPNFGTFDNNYYCRPIDDDVTIYAEYFGNLGTISNFMNLEKWQSTFNYDLNSKKSPYTISEYKITDFLGTSKFENGNFNSDIKGWDYFSNYNNGYASWDNNSNLDGGCLKMGFNSSSGKPDGAMIAYSSFGEAIAGENYILKFSMIASSPGKIVKISMCKGGIPYNRITSEQYLSIDTKRKEYELLFTPDTTETNARIDFEIKEDVGPVWIDNVELYQANIQTTNIEDSILFVYNPTNIGLTINNGNNYVDVKGTKYSGSITLLPYSSAVLMIDHNPSSPPVIPVYISSAIENATPARLEMTYNLSLANSIPAVSAFTVRVNSVARTVNSVAISGTKVLLTIASPVVNGDIVTITYTKPSTNPLQIASGGIAASISNQPVVNNCINGTTTVNQPPVVTISNPRKGNKYENISTITIDAIASDPDGTVVKVEFYNGSEKLVELTSPPYSYTWKDVGPGTYSITAIATDNLNATTTSAPIEFEVASNSKYDANSEILNLYPNPNDGHFSIELINPLQNEKSKITISDLTGKQVYQGTLLKEETIKQIDLSYIKSGIYILIIIYNEIAVTKKFIKC
jgi:uncharacterized repeat protein (TIGR02059 family)